MDAHAPRFDGPPPQTALPPVDLREAERIITHLIPAEQWHVAWVRAVHTALVCRALRGVGNLLRTEAADTPFGRWLNDETDPYVRAHPGFAIAKQALEQAFALARQMLTTVAGGGTVSEAEYIAFSDRLSQFDTVQADVMKEVWDLLRYTDPLTGVATRFAMIPRLKQERERARRTGTPCCVCMIDLDHFKAINDTYGHSAGDAVLTGVTSYLLNHLRHQDQIYRYGGEEFVLVLPETDLVAALPLVDRLRQGIAALATRLPSGEQMHVTASFGIAPLVPRESSRIAIDRADLAMYAAKRAGRNRVELWKF